MILNHEERRRIANSLIGYGNPETAKIAVFGIEEGGKQWGEYPEEDDQRLVKAKQYLKDGFWARKHWPQEWYDIPIRTTERVQCYFCLKMQGKIEHYNTEQIQQFRKDKFCQEHEIVGNIYPIGKPSIKDNYDPETVAYFSFNDSRSLCEYWESISKERLQLIRQALENISKRNGVIVFMGFVEDKAKDLIKNLFGENQYEKLDLSLSGRYFDGRKYKRHRWIGILREKNLLCCFAPHPTGGGFTFHMANALSDMIGNQE